MGRNFFTGGVIPSTKLFYFFTKDLVVQDQWALPVFPSTSSAWGGCLHRVLHAHQGGGGQEIHPRTALLSWDMTLWCDMRVVDGVAKALVPCICTISI